MNKLFIEAQKFRQWWLWLILLGAMFLTLLLWWQGFTSEELEARDHTGLLIVLFIELVIAVLFRIMVLQTRIDKTSILIHFYPFVRKEIPWSEVQSADVLNYGFVGGWGIRFFTKYGTVYNIKGNKGLALLLKNGKKLLVGTQKEEELTKFLEEHILSRLQD